MQVGPKDPQEIKTVIFDFTNQLGGNTIVSTVITVSVLMGVDAAAAGLVSGAAVVSGSLVRQKIANGGLGVEYKISCLLVDSTGQKHLVSAELDIVRG